jgi:hypothetical protein
LQLARCDRSYALPSLACSHVKASEMVDEYHPERPIVRKKYVLESFFYQHTRNGALASHGAKGFIAPAPV